MQCQYGKSRSLLVVDAETYFYSCSRQLPLWTVRVPSRRINKSTAPPTTPHSPLPTHLPRRLLSPLTTAGHRRHGEHRGLEARTGGSGRQRPVVPRADSRGLHLVPHPEDDAHACARVGQAADGRRERPCLPHRLQSAAADVPRLGNA